MNTSGAVVIGSGSGASVMAYKLAEAGLAVCLLERGKAYPPNSFARSPYALSDSALLLDQSATGSMFISVRSMIAVSIKFHTVLFRIKALRENPISVVPRAVKTCTVNFRAGKVGRVQRGFHAHIVQAQVGVCKVSAAKIRFNEIRTL
ncbi:MAG TPA: hypothetical protein VGX92_07355 [Pyrinomonadaceae bacterium]|nr:hypothetical protein [Pyrinomonadaceae bacterium]